MAKYATCELREKNVVNVCTAETLGKIIEFEIDVNCGRITCLIVGENTLLNLFKKDFVRIKWDDIRQIGDDTILVEIEGYRKRSSKKCCDNKDNDRKCR